MTPERGKTWFKWYRKTEMSDIWTRHPLYLKVWAWLLANVDQDTGEFTCTYEHIADRVQWIDKGHPHVPSRKVIHDILHWMKLNSMLRITTLGDGNRKYTKVNICLWETYQSKTSSVRNRTKTEKLLSSKNKEDTTTDTSTFVASHDAIRCLKAWEQYRPIIEKHRDTYLQVFDELHRIDKLPWEGEDGIFAICAFAVKEWTAKMIQAPSKLRKASQKYPELKTWQVIQGQLTDRHAPNKSERNGSTELTDDLKAAIAKRMPHVHG